MAEATAYSEASSASEASRAGLQPHSSAAEVPCARLASLTLEEKPTCIICLGMAGSGKTTFVQVARDSKEGGGEGGNLLG